MKAYLLYKDQDFNFEAPLPPNHEDLTQDLELTVLLQAMAQGDRFLGDVVTKVLLAGADNPRVIRYRQRVLADCLAEPEILRNMYAITEAAVEDRRKMWGYHSPYPTAVLSGAVTQLEAAFTRLKQLRKIADDNVNRFHSEGLVTLCRTLQRELDDEYLQAIHFHLQTLRFRNGPLISAELDRDNSPIHFVLRSERHGKMGWKERLGIRPRSSYFFMIAPRDEASERALSDLNDRGINHVANAVAQSADHILSYFTALRAELGFYVSCLNLRETLGAKNAPIAFPDPCDWEPLCLTIEDLRDASLTLRSEQPVVGNNVHGDGKSLVIITGANSGGKSTFLRSVGLAQLMMGCGMFVVAKSYRANICRGIFTHFTREEDAAMVSGHLDEELKRMSTIADQIRPHSLMLFNESFSTTNEREGSEIGRQVVRSLLDADIKVVFVTHQFDLAESFYLNADYRASTLFLRAPREPGGRRSYQLEVAAPLPTSFGEDLYYRVGGWLDEDKDRIPAKSPES